MSKLDQLYDELDALRERKYNIEEQIDQERSRLAKLVTVEKRKASMIFTCGDLSIHVPKNRNRYNERKIHWYDGRKTSQISDSSRASNYEWKIWLANASEIGVF